MAFAAGNTDDLIMAATESAHEDLSRQDEVKMGSERSFGLVFAAFCLIVFSFQFWAGTGRHWYWLAASAVFVLAAVFVPRVLRPLNLVWFKFGMLLHHVISPVILGLMFFIAFTPIGLLMRLVGKRPLSLEFDREADSYWISRTPPGPPPESFPNQF